MRNLLVAVLLSAVAVAAPAQQEAKNPALEQAPKSAAGGRAANLPDFTALMKEQGPAVVNVITKREAKTARNEPRGGAGSSSPEDPLAEFFRRFMPDAPERGPGGGQGGPGQGGPGQGAPGDPVDGMS